MLPKNPHSHEVRIPRYLIVGTSTAMLDFLLFIVIYHLLPNHILAGFYPEQWANAVAIGIAFIYSYIMHRKWSFQSHGSLQREFLFMLLLLLINMAISSWGISILNRDFGVSVAFAKIGFQALVTSWNYLLFNYFIFK